MERLLVTGSSGLSGHMTVELARALQRENLEIPPERMSLEWVERIPSPPIEDVIKSSLGISTEGYIHQIHFYYPKVGGIQALTKSLENKIGAPVVTNFEVVKISRTNGKVVE